VPTLGYQNRQATTPFVVTNGVELDVLATTDSANDYLDGMSVNGGATLHLEVDALLALANLELKVYRRSDRGSAWGIFFVQTVVLGKVHTVDVGGLAGYSDVRCTLKSTAADGAVTVAAKITIFPAPTPQP